MPGLVLALRWPRGRRGPARVAARRCEFLEAALERLGLARPGRAFAAGGPRTSPATRSSGGAFDLVVARAFGRPAVTAECAVGLPRAGGRLVVSEPPEGASGTRERWPEDGLGELGFGPAVPLRVGGAGAVVLAALGEPRRPLAAAGGPSGEAPALVARRVLFHVEHPTPNLRREFGDVSRETSLTPALG